jgi:hypothetical protein
MMDERGLSIDHKRYGANREISYGKGYKNVGLPYYLCKVLLIEIFWPSKCHLERRCRQK